MMRHHSEMFCRYLKQKIWIHLTSSFPKRIMCQIQHSELFMLSNCIGLVDPFLWILDCPSSWGNHHCEKHGNTQISPNLSHKLWKRLAPGMPYQTKPGLPSGCQVNIKCFYAKSTCLGSNYRNINSLTQKLIPGYLQRTVDNYSRAYLWLISHDLSHGVPLMFLMHFI
jgi:hypothetical protein